MWEYKTKTFKSDVANKRSLKEKCDAVLKKYSNDGWELVNFQCIGAFGSIMMFIFKRAK